eukprot:700400-Pleurochrysis_carterae.AAC.1
MWGVAIVAAAAWAKFFFLAGRLGGFGLGVAVLVGACPLGVVVKLTEGVILLSVKERRTHVSTWAREET